MCVCVYIYIYMIYVKLVYLCIYICNTPRMPRESRPAPAAAVCPGISHETLIKICMHIYIYIYIYTHTYIYIYIYIYIHIRVISRETLIKHNQTPELTITDDNSKRMNKAD